MNSNRTEGNWKQLAETIKRRLDKLADQQVDLWSGRRDRAKRVADTPARQQGIEPPK
jgi:uncharacterized protein YjbJ (UPF0337 family)